MVASINLGSNVLRSMISKDNNLQRRGFPEIPISQETKIWLEAAYSRLKSGKKIDPTEMLVELWDKLPDFDYKNIDRRLFQSDRGITLLGILHVHSTTDFVQKTDQVITFISQLMRQTPGIEEITAHQVAEGTRIHESEVPVIFNLMSHLGRFWISASGDWRNGYTSIGLNHEEVKREYLGYKKIDILIYRFYDLYEPKQEMIHPIGSCLPDFPPEIQESIVRFRNDHPNKTKAAFVMMKLSKTKAHEEIVKAIKDTLSQFGIQGVRADDKQYHDDLFPNILTYIYGCEFGIAVFERIETDEFNPNVSLEVGYMLALRKPVCLLKDKTLETLHTDLVGKLYRPFDPQDISDTVSKELMKWLSDKDIVSNIIK